MSEDREPDALVREAALWLVHNRRRDEQPRVIPYICKTFGLSPLQAVEAIREANLIRARAL